MNLSKQVVVIDFEKEIHGEKVLVYDFGSHDVVVENFKF